MVRDNPTVISETAHHVDDGLSIVLGIKNLSVLSVEKPHVEELTTFMKKYSLLPRDSLHLSVMLLTGCKNIASADKDFDRAVDITRWSPT